MLSRSPVIREADLLRVVRREGIAAGTPFGPAFIAKQIHAALENEGLADPGEFAEDSDPYDVAVLTALVEERKAVIEQLPELTPLPSDDDDVRTWWSGWIDLKGARKGRRRERYRIALGSLEGQMGRVEATTLASDALRRFRPRAIILCGICGGIAEKEVSICDVVIANQVVDFALNKATSSGDSRRYKGYPVDRKLLNFATSLDESALGKRLRRAIGKKAAEGVTVHVGDVASSDNVVEDDSVVTNLLAHWPNMIAIEMEAGGLGATLATAVKPPTMFMVRAASDLANAEKGSKKVKSQRKAACTVAACFLAELILARPFIPRKTS